VVGFCKQENKPSDFMNSGDFLEYLEEYELLRKYGAN
jgi:hypothetical protein